LARLNADGTLDQNFALDASGAIGVLDRHHDRHVVVQDLDSEVGTQFTEDFFFLDLHDATRTMVRIHDLVSDFVQLTPPGRP